MMKRYDNYKPSGIEWIGEIPSHWEVTKLKYVDEVIMGQSPESELCNTDGDGLPFLQGNAEFTDLYPVAKLWCSNPPKASQMNDVLFSVRAPIGAVNISDRVYGIGRGLAAIRGNYSNHKFLFYLSQSLNEELNSIGTGSTFTAISVGDLRNVFIPKISKEEQTAIAAYLNEKTSQIDTLIKKKEELLVLLQKKRQAIISEAVTRGLDKTSKTKPSGIDWLGEIPAHWEVKKLKYIVTKIGSGVTPTGGAETYLDEGIPLLRSQNIYNDGLRLDDVAFISQETHDSMSNTKVQQGDVLLNITGASIGRAFYFDGSLEEANVNQHVCIVRPKHEAINTRFLHFFLISNIGQLQIELSQTGANREGLNNFQLSNFVVAFPSVEEQKSIVSTIDKVLENIDKCNQEITTQLEKLKTYRQSLIAEVVTGKVKVV